MVEVEALGIILVVVILGLFAGLGYTEYTYKEQMDGYTEAGFKQGYIEHNESVYEYYQLVIYSYSLPAIGNEEYYTAAGYVNGYNQYKLDSMKKSLGV